jgi:hypothetical protein
MSNTETTGYLDRLRGRDGVTVDAVYGAVVTVVLSFIPFSSVLGGGVAGFRQECGYLRGGGVGLLAGILAAIPLVALFVPALWIAGSLGFGVAPSSPAYDVFLALVGVFFLVYTVGFSALGGVVGVWIRHNTDWAFDPGQWV